MKLCLGKKPARRHPKQFYAARYFTSTLPAPSPSRSWSAGMPDDLGMLGNDSVGDCAEAMVLHGIEVERFRNGAPLTFDTSAAIALYSEAAGYDPAKPETDQGTDLLALMGFMANTGFAGHMYGPYVSLLTPSNTVDVDLLKTGGDLFGPVKIGVQLPESALADFAAGRPWTSVDDEPIAGGHAILLVDYDADGAVFVTWGKRQRANWPWVVKHVDEAFADLSPDWVSGAKPAPNGFALAQLQRDLAQIGAAA